MLVYYHPWTMKWMAEIVREVLYRKWALEILRFLSEEGTQNYNQIEAQFDTSSDVITGRLRDLEQVGFIIRNEKSARNVRYSITPSGERVLELMDEIYELVDE